MRKYIYQFIPENFYYLTKVKKIEYKGKNLKTAYLINIIHQLILKYFNSDNKEMKFNLWSVILTEKYGSSYNYYIDYLIEKKFLTLVSNYFVAKKSKTYLLNYFDLSTIKRCQVYDNILLKKHDKKFLLNSITEYNNNQIPENIKRKLIDDLYHITIDYDNSIKFLESMRTNGIIDDVKYWKNMISINSIKTGYLFFTFDEYGRFHTNFTNLKREIRQNFLKIDGMETDEIDIKNSQPLFLSILLKKEFENSEDEEIKRYMWLVNNGLFYNDFINRFPDKFKNRTEVKLVIYKIIFGRNNHNNEYNVMFKNLYPKIYEFIKQYKDDNNSYKSLSHTLQKIESEFIYNQVVQEIMDKYPSIKLFTVHDSIIFPIKYKKEIESIFNEKLNNLKK